MVAAAAAAGVVVSERVVFVLCPQRKTAEAARGRGELILGVIGFEGAAVILV